MTFEREAAPGSTSEAAPEDLTAEQLDAVVGGLVCRKAGGSAGESGGPTTGIIAI